MHDGHDEGGRRQAIAGYGPRVALALGWLLIVPLAVLLLARLVAPDRGMLSIAVAALTPYLFLPAYPLALAARWKRRWALASVALVVAGFHASCVAPSLLPGPRLPDDVADRPALRLVSANLLMVNSDTDGLALEILAADPDVILVQEYSSRWNESFARHGILDAYPQAIGVVRDDSFGTAILSRLPLEDAEVVDVHGLPMTRATVVVGDRRLRLLNVHTLPPRTPEYTVTWRAQMAWLRDEILVESRPLAVVGDFNATQHFRRYKQLLLSGVVSAHELRGRGWATTFPNGVFPLPPMRLDHALISPDLTCIAIGEGEGAGSDHRPLIIDLALEP